MPANKNRRRTPRPSRTSSVTPTAIAAVVIAVAAVIGFGLIRGETPAEQDASPRAAQTAKPAPPDTPPAMPPVPTPTAAAPEPATPVVEPGPRNLLRNGNLDDIGPHGMPEGWKHHGQDKIGVKSDGDNNWVILNNGGMLEQRITLDPTWRSLEIGARMKAESLVLGDQAWQCFRIALRFDDPDGKTVGYPAMPELQADSDWMRQAVTIDIPRDKSAATLVVQIALFGKSGICQADDLTVTLLDATSTAPAGALAAQAAPAISDVFLKTSTRRKEVVAEIEFTDLAADGILAVTALMLDESGKEEKRFTSEVGVRAGPSQVVSLRWAWPDPRLWDLGRPNLYTARISATGADIDLTYEQRFGFREIWIEGRDFYLNGTVVRFRPNNVGWGPGHNAGADENAVRTHMKAGFNLLEVWPGDNDFSRTNDALGAACDIVGIGMTGATPNSGKFEDWNNVATKARYQAELRRFIRKARNHPSILMWGSSGNRYLHASDQAPRLIGRRDWTVDKETALRNERGADILATVKAYDPTRPLFTHAGAYVGDVYTLNNYLDFLPLQEREDWLSDWATNGEMPVMMVEFGTPLYTTYLRGRNHYGHALPTEPLATEWAAIYFGPKAYEDERPEYRAAIRARFVNGMKYKPWRDGRGWDKALVTSPALVDTQRLFLKNTWRAWRTWGISGGMVPWEEASGHLELLEPHNEPTLAYIAGPETSFTDKSHNYVPGARVAKSVVLVNDDREPLQYSASWTATFAGRSSGSGKKSGTLQPSEILFVPVAFRTPAVSDTTTGTLTMKARIGRADHSDEFALHVVPRPKPARGSVYVFDPVGKTAAMLRTIGVRATALSSTPRAGSTVVVGRNVLSSTHRIPFDVSAFVKSGGRLLVMTQDDSWFTHGLGLRTARQMARRAFRVVPAHPVVAGIGDAELSDWAGESTLEDTTYRFNGNDPWFPPLFGWRWGARGMVSNAPLEKPHRTSWRPLLECEFDLAYSPLMEMEYGRGRVTMCTLDLEDKVSTDACAGRLAAQLLTHVTSAAITPKAARVSFCGSDAGHEFLTELGVVCEKVDSLSGARGVAILDATADAGAMDAFARRGGNVVVLRLEKDALGVHVRRSDSCAGATSVPRWPECAGLSLSDVRWRCTHAASLLADSPGLELAASGFLGRRKVGNGVILHCQIDPRALPADEKTYFRYTRWRQTRALCQILSNVGVPFRQDDRFMSLLQEPDHPVFLEGTWQAQLTTPFDEKHPRSGNGDPGMSARAKQLVAISAPADGWQNVYCPAYMESNGEGWFGKDGEAVFRKVIRLPPHLAGRDLVLSVGRVDEKETSYFNGVEIGSSSHWLDPRSHVVPGKLVKGGENVIAVRTFDSMVHGGMCAQPARFYIAPVSEPSGFYHDDYKSGLAKDDFEQGDDPYRYFRW